MREINSKAAYIIFLFIIITFKLLVIGLLFTDAKVSKKAVFYFITCIKYFILCNKAREKQEHLTVNLRMRDGEKLLIYETKHVWESFHNFANRTKDENQSNNLIKYKL